MATAGLAFEHDALNRVTKDTRKGVITDTYTYHAGGQLATEATPQWAEQHGDAGLHLSPATD